MATHATNLRWLLGLCLLLALPNAAFAQATPPPPAPPAAAERIPAVPAHEYRAKAMTALDSGKPELAGRILMLSYQDHGDTEALRIAGMVFMQAGNRRMAWQAWSIFLCNSSNGKQRREVRIQLHTMMPKKAPMACMHPRPADAIAHATEPAPPRTASDPKPPRRERIDRSSAKSPPWKFELETGITVGDDAFAMTWAPGVLFGKRRGTRFGVYIPIAIGEKLYNEASIGLEPRIRFPFGEDMSLELGGGVHAGDDADTYSASVGVNFSEVLTVGVSYEALKDDRSRYDYEDYDYDTPRTSGAFLNAKFTGKTGKTITAIEAGLGLLILGLAVGG